MKKVWQNCLPTCLEPKRTPPPTRHLGRTRQTNNECDSEPEDTPVANKHAKKSSPDDIKALKQRIWTPKKANPVLNAILEARTTRAAEVKAAREEQETLFKQQKKQTSSLKASQRHWNRELTWRSQRISAFGPASGFGREVDSSLSTMVKPPIQSAFNKACSNSNSSVNLIK